MPENQAFSINHLAQELGHDRRSLARWLRDVTPAGHVAGHAVYNLYDVQRAVAAATQRGRRTSAARDRLLGLQADRLEYQIAVLKGEYVRAVDVASDVAKMIGEARRVLDAGPPSLAPQVVGVSIAEAEGLLREWIQTALTQLHKDPFGDAATQPSPAEIIGAAPEPGGPSTPTS